MSRVCTKCGEEKSLEDFYFRKDSGKHRNDCTECVKAGRRKHRKDKPEVVNASNRKSYAKNIGQRFSRKASQWNLKHGGQVTGRQIELLMESHGYTCYYCGSISDWLHVDHVTPVSRGGKNEIQNCVPSCSSCNTSKRDRTEFEFSSYSGANNNE